jgi:FemAB-related protein (PEP-CTERM system-associated)
VTFVSDAAPRVEVGKVVVRPWTDGESWDAFVQGAGDSTVAHRWVWLEVARRAYGHRTVALAALRGGRIVGVLPLVCISSRLLGRHVVSMPYLDSGGVCTDGDDAAEDALVAEALRIATETRSALELRQYRERRIPMSASTHKVTMTIDLSGGEAEVWAALKSNRRGQVRKATRNGLTGELAGGEALDDFYRVLATNMRDLGSPMHRKRFFAAALELLADDARLVIVKDEGVTVGAGLILVHGDVATLPFSSSLRESFARGTNQLLYWTAVKHALELGCTTFDFGRSTPGSGTYEAKREWGAGTHQLYWYQDPPADHGSTERLQQRVAAVWSRLPVTAATSLGSLIRGSLPQ